MPTCTISRPQNLRGNSCVAIPRINVIIERRLAGLLKRRRYPRSRGDPGGYDFLIDPDLRADSAPLIWLPQLDPTTVLIVPATEGFAAARSLSGLSSRFGRSGPEGEYRLVDASEGRLPVMLTQGASPPLPAAVLIPIDDDFPARADAAMRLWRTVTGRPRRRAPERLTRQRHDRLTLTLRALDGRLAGASYRDIAQGLFGQTRVPAGAGWKTHELRDRTIRLARAGLELMRGGYLDLLRYPQSRRE
jgi:hypothetical protein